MDKKNQLDDLVGFSYPHRITMHSQPHIRFSQTDLKDRSEWPPYSGFMGVYCDVYVLRGSGNRGSQHPLYPRQEQQASCTNQPTWQPTDCSVTYVSKEPVCLIFCPEEGDDNANCLQDKDRNVRTWNLAAVVLTLRGRRGISLGSRANFTSASQVRKRPMMS